MANPTKTAPFTNGDRRSSGSKLAQPLAATLWLMALTVALTFLITPTLYYESWTVPVGTVVSHDIRAPFSVDVVNPVVREALHRQVEASSEYVFTFDLSVAGERAAKAHEVIETIQSPAPLSDAGEISPEAWLNAQRAVERDHGFTLSERTVSTLLARGHSDQFRSEINQAFEYLYNHRGVEENNVASVVRRHHADGSLALVFTNGRPENVAPEHLDIERVFDRSHMRDAGPNAVAQETMLTGDDRVALEDLVRELVNRGNVKVNTEETVLRLEAAHDAVDPALSKFPLRADEVIVEANGEIEAVAYDKLLAIDAARPYYRLFNLGSNGAIVFIVLMFLLFHVRRFRGDWSYTAANVNMLVLPLVLTLGIGKVLLLSMPSAALASLFFPAGALGMLGVILIGPRIGLMVTFSGCLLFGFMTRMDFSAVFVAVIGGGAAVTALYTLRRRRDIMMAGVAAGMASALAILTVRFTADPAMFSFEGWEESITHMAVGLANGALGCTMITLISLVIFEYAFRVTTDLNLIELTSLKTPLLKEMEEKTPGTYQHTLNVTKLAEGAAMAIDANYLLVRAGAHYHDIGKMVKPKYFTENQATAEERRIHQKLVPSLSALIIKEHVKKGIELARMHRLPEKVIDFIPQHHGTSLIKYFHNEAQRRFAAGETSDPVREDDYRYPGPNPQYVETAILMLADSVEATATSKLTSTNVNSDDVERLVRDTIREKFNDGQLDECDLSLADLNRIRASFVHTLMARYHQRIDYPSAPGVVTRGA